MANLCGSNPKIKMLIIRLLVLIHGLDNFLTYEITTTDSSECKNGECWSTSAILK